MQKEDSPAPDKPCPSGWEDSLPKLLTVSLQLLSLIGIGLTSLGFGATLALGTFRVDIVEMISGPFDLLRLSAYPFIEIYNKVSGQLGNWWAVAWMTGGACAALVVLIYAVHLAFNEISRLRVLRRRASGVARSAREVATSLAKGQLFRVPRVALLTLGSATALIASAMVLPLGLMTILAAPALIGYQAAKSFYAEAVIKPSTCAPLRTAAQLRAEMARASDKARTAADANEPQASCVAYYARDFGEIRGRFVIATSEAIALFDPFTGTSIVLPKRAAMVWSVATVSPFAAPQPQGSGDGDVPVHPSGLRLD